MSRAARRPLRVARRVLLVIVAAVATWLLAVNGTLWTGIVERAVSGQKLRANVVLEHGFAWCIWPTRVHVRDLSLRVDGHSWQLDLHIDRATLDLSLAELLTRRFYVTDLDSYGTDIVRRAKRDALDEDTLALLPPMRDRPEPIRADEPPPIPPADRAWTVELARARFDLDRVWIDGMRAEVDASLAGSMFVVAGRAFAAPAARLDVDDAIAFLGDELLASSIRGRVVLGLDPHDHTEVTGRDVLRQMRGLVELRAAVADLDAVRRWLPASTRRTHARGDLVVDASLWSGVLLPGASARYHSPHATTRVGSTRVTAAVDLYATIAARSRAEIAIDLQRVTGRAPRHDDPWLRADRVHGRA